MPPGKKPFQSSHHWPNSCLFLLAGIGILLGHIQEPGISSVAEGYGAVLLRNGADLYVTIGIASFTAGVVMTIICIRWRKKKWPYIG